jgi:hypothetical protein
MTAIESSNLAAADYNPFGAVLTIQFHSGGTYEYYEVPPQVFDGLTAAESPGRFHHLHIKHRYPYRRLL